MTALRKVMVTKYITRPMSSEVADAAKGITGRSISTWEEVGEAWFHGFGTDYEEFENGPGNFSTAIVEWPDGKVEMVRADAIRFMLPIDERTRLQRSRTTPADGWVDSSEARVFRVVDTDNFDGDYPDEKFVGPRLTRKDAEAVAAACNRNGSGPLADRFFKLVEDSVAKPYKLQPGFEP